jgi:soluble P-type ATPase
MRFTRAAALLGAVVAVAWGGGGARQATQVSVQVQNTLNQAVNVYVSSGGTDTFLRQVAANSTVSVPVAGYAAGTSVTLKAVTVDGVHTYTRNNVVLNGTFTFPLP